MIVFATDQKVAQATGTPIGDLTGGGGLAAARDGTISQAIAASASKTSSTGVYVGVTLPAVKKLTRAIVFGTDDQGYVSGANPAVAHYLYGKNGSAPANSGDGNLLTLNPGFTDTADESGTPRQIVAGDTLPSDYYLHQWVRVEQGGGAATMAVAEVIFYESWSPPLLPGYTLDNPIIVYQNIVTASGVDSTTEEAEFPATNLANPSTSLKWRGTSVVADEYLTFTVGSEINCVCVARHNWSSAGITPSLGGRVGSDPFLEIIPAFTPTDDGPLMMVFPAETLSEVRIKLPPGTEVPEAAVAYVGTTLTLQRRISVNHVPITMGREINAVAPTSESGEFLGGIVLGQHSDSEIALENLTQAWVRESLDPFLLVASRRTPFFWARRPNTYPEETAYAWFPPGTSPKPVIQRPNGMMQISMPTMGITT